MKHPDAGALRGHLARRLVWGWFPEDRLMTPFRVCEDGSLASVRDDSMPLPEDAQVLIPHPVELGHEETLAWSQLLSDYQILQPFPQVGREVYLPTEQERTALFLTRVEGIETHAGRLLAPAHLPQEQSQRPGHVPSARNIPWSKAANDDGTFRSDDELKELYEDEGVDLSKDTIAYCRIGERSAHTWFVLHELLGQENVKNYDGSWTEYGSLVGVPTELGAAT